MSSGREVCKHRFVTDTSDGLRAPNGGAWIEATRAEHRRWEAKAEVIFEPRGQESLGNMVSTGP